MAEHIVLEAVSAQSLIFVLVVLRNEFRVLDDEVREVHPLFIDMTFYDTEISQHQVYDLLLLFRTGYKCRWGREGILWVRLYPPYQFLVPRHFYKFKLFLLLLLRILAFLTVPDSLAENLMAVLQHLILILQKSPIILVKLPYFRPIEPVCHQIQI